MQSVSGTLAAAILAQERSPVCLVEVDWARDGYGGPGTIDDLTPMVSGLSVSRALTTDLPEEARPFSGIAAASATVELAKNDEAASGQHAVWYFSPYNTASPLFGMDRKGAPARISIGFRTSAGLEYVRVLTGRVRRPQTSSRNRSATLELVDNSEALRKQVTLPMIIADDGTVADDSKKPGLTGAFLAHHVLRQCGFYASPPVRANCVLSATLHGSGWPEVGTITRFRGANFTQLAFPPATDGFTVPAKWVASVQTSGISSQTIWYTLAGSVSPNTSGRLFVEGWWRFDDIGIGDHSAIWKVFRNGTSDPYVSAWIDPIGRLQVDLHRGGADTPHSTGTSGPSGFVNSTWYYIGVYVEFNSGNVNVWLRKDAAAWVGPVTVTTTGSQAAGVMDSATIAQGNAASYVIDYLDGNSEAVQITTENGAGTPPTANNAFVPTAQVMAGKNDLIATPVLSEQAWNILQKLADAELGMAGCLEDGTPYFRDRSFLTTAPQTVSQRTLSATDAIIDLDSDESVDSVRNHIIIKANPPDVQAAKDVWKLTTLVKILASGSKTFWASFDTPAGNIDTTPTSHGANTATRYNASTTRDGSGSVVSNLSFTITPFAQSAKIVVTNPNAFTVYLVGNTGVANVSPGVPSLILHGDRVLFDQTTDDATGVLSVNQHQRQEASDAISIAAFEEQPLELPDNPFRQDLDSIGLTATDLLAMLKDGKPTVQGLAIVGDPRLQLGDRDTLVDANGLVISADVHLAEIQTSFTSGDDGKLTQTISTRAV
jgi:hypothetical protein